MAMKVRAVMASRAMAQPTASVTMGSVANTSDNPGGTGIQHGNVQQRDQHAELSDADQGHRQQIRFPEGWPCGAQAKRQQEHQRDGVAEKSKPPGAHVCHNRLACHQCRTHLHAGHRRRQQRQPHSARAQTWPTRCLPKL